MPRRSDQPRNTPAAVIVGDPSPAPGSAGGSPGPALDGRGARDGVAAGPERREPGQDEIRKLAHRIYEGRCRDNTPGDERSDWLEAERRIRQGLLAE